MKATVTRTDLATRLLAVRTAADVEAIVAAIPNARWRHLGDKPGNYALVHVGSDPADALMERVTNAMDAVLEREAERRGELGLPDPREAASKLLGVPAGRIWKMKDGPSATREEARRALAKQVVLTLREGTRREHPTAVVADAGIGQHPSNFPSTLTSLNESNKRDKFYLLGAYGWGGASVYAFSKYTVVVSRRQPDLLDAGQDDSVGWTIIRYNDLEGDRYSKTGVYEYLVLDDPSDALGAVPRLDPADLPKTHADYAGTIVAMVDFELSRYVSEPTWRGSKSMWVLAGALMFDPIMPFLLRDERPRAGANLKSALDGLVINGAATRLTEARGRKLDYGQGRVELDSTLRDSQKITLTGRYDGILTGGGHIGVRWWVIGEKADSKKDWEPISAYVPPDQAVTVAHNGQRHESYTRLALEKPPLSLLSLSKFMVVQVDTDSLGWQEKRGLFSSTRDRLKVGPVKAELLEAINTALRDEDLRREERNRKERALARRSHEQADRIRKRLAKAVAAMREGNEQKYHIVMSANEALPLFDDQPLADDPPKGKPDEGTTEIAEPTNYSGEPTFLRVLNAPVNVPAGGRAVVRLAIDAPDDFFSDNPERWLPIVSKGNDAFAVTGYSDVRSGRMRATVAARTPGVGERGRVIFTVLPSASGGLPLVAEADLATVEPPRAKEKRVKAAGIGKGKEAGPNVEPIGREQWQAFGFEEDTIAKVDRDTTDKDLLTIYVNVEYPPIERALLARPKTGPSEIEEYKDGFATHMALLAWLQFSQQQGEVSQPELQRAATAWLFSNLG
jgi:hypothetical protein